MTGDAVALGKGRLPNSGSSSGAGRSGVAARRVGGRMLLYLVVVLGGLFFAVPFLWSATSALKGPWEILEYPPTLFPEKVRWINFVHVFERAPFARWALNSITVAALATLGEVLTSSLVAFGFARFRFPGRRGLFLLVLSTLMLPWQVTIIPRFLLFRFAGWLDTLRPLIIPSWFGGSAFQVFLLRQFFMTIPLDYDDAAKMDGASFFHIYRHVILPLSIPALTTVTLFAFLAHWGNFIGPLIYLNSPKTFPLALGLRYYEQIPMAFNEPREHLLMAASLLMVLPCVVLFFAGQKYFVRGVVMSGLKG